MFTLYVLGSFISGVLAGSFLRPGRKVLKLLSSLQTAGILTLVFLMGLAISSDSSVWINLKAIGLKSLVFGALTALTGAFGAFWAGKIIEKNLKEAENTI